MKLTPFAPRGRLKAEEDGEVRAQISPSKPCQGLPWVSSLGPSDGTNTFQSSLIPHSNLLLLYGGGQTLNGTGSGLPQL